MAAPAQASGRQELILGADPGSIREARVWLSALATGLIDGSRRPDLELVVAEVVTNAGGHGAATGPLLLAATPKPEFLCVQVTDEGAGFVPSPGAMASDANGGFWVFPAEEVHAGLGVNRPEHRTHA